MKRCVILFFLVLTNILPAEEELDFFDLEVSKEQVLDKRQNYFLTKTDYKIAPKVNPITGEYTEEEVDLVVAGSQPLSSRRFYNSSAPYDPRYATWRYNPEALGYFGATEHNTSSLLNRSCGQVSIRKNLSITWEKK